MISDTIDTFNTANDVLDLLMDIGRKKKKEWEKNKSKKQTKK